MTKTITDEQIQERAERYARSIITYESRIGKSTGSLDRMPVSDAFAEGYKAAMQDRKEYDVHQLECHADCSEGRHHKNCPWKKASDDLFQEKF